MTELSRRKLFKGAAAATAASAAAMLPVPAQAAAPAAGKQNPGWYRYKVGDFEVTVITDGVATNPLTDKYVTNAPVDAVAKELASQHRAQDKLTHTFTPIVVNTGSKLVAIDTGLGLAMHEKTKGAAGQYHTNLKAAGFDASAIDVVIISHFHGDHINGLVGEGNKPAFANAEVMVPEAEWAFWTGQVPDAAKANAENVKRVFDVLGNKVTKYQAGKELVPGITSIATPGHTPGHSSHMISSGSSTVLAQADITAGAATLFVHHPDWQPAFDVQKDVAVATRKKMYDMVIADKIPVQGFHFAFPSLVNVEKSGDGYRLIPAPWNPTI